MELNFNLHTVIMLIGPTECGKSTFSKQILLPQLEFYDKKSDYRSNVQYLSSDVIRQQLLGYAYDKYNENMLEASKQAFHLLYTNLELMTSYPINADFVVVDTIGLSEEHRKQVKEIATTNGYDVAAVVFDYKKRSDYYHSKRSKDIISKHLSRLKTEVLSVLAKEGYQQVIRIKEKNFLEKQAQYNVKINQLNEYLDCQLPQDENYLIIGDVHEQIDALKSLITKNGYLIDENNQMIPVKEKAVKFILVGDYIDKGHHTKETIEFLYQNQPFFYILIGNHEHFDYLWLHGNIAQNSIETSRRNTYFSAIPILEEDEQLRLKFFELVENALPFVHYVGLTRKSFYVTHAPCQTKYLGKISKVAKRNQRNFRLNREEAMEPQLAFLQEEHNFNMPYYFFGHVMSKKVIKLKNVIGLDTGAGSNHVLAAVDVFPKRLAFQSVPIEQEALEAIPILFEYKREPKKVEMTESLQRRIDYFVKNKINYFAGTISPADKKGEELESLEEGLNFFAKRNVQHLTLQPKYMGSRCTIYLHRDLDKCYATSRKGYVIKQIDMTEIYQNLYARLEAYFIKENIELLIIDGELMPWKALGAELIDNHYLPIVHGLENEQETLKASGFYQIFAQIMEEEAFQQFVIDRNLLNKKAMIEKYGDNKYQTYHEVLKLSNKIEGYPKQSAALTKYQEQLAIYSEDCLPHYKPFTILKTILQDGTETQSSGKVSEIYQLLNDDATLEINLQDDDAFLKAQQFFHTLTTDLQMEGVVIKPLNPEDNERSIPFLKVRNEAYLSLIYGYDYQFSHKYQQLLKNKKIGRKLRASFDEYILGEQLLKIPYHKINAENLEYIDIVMKLLGEIEKEVMIDPRL